MKKGKPGSFRYFLSNFSAALLSLLLSRIFSDLIIGLAKDGDVLENIWNIPLLLFYSALSLLLSGLWSLFLRMAQSRK